MRQNFEYDLLADRSHEGQDLVCGNPIIFKLFKQHISRRNLLQTNIVIGTKTQKDNFVKPMCHLQEGVMVAVMSISQLLCVVAY